MRLIVSEMESLFFKIGMIIRRGKCSGVIIKVILERPVPVIKFEKLNI